MNKLIIILLKTTFASLAIWYLFKSSKISAETFVNMFSPTFMPLFFYSASAFLISQAIISIRLLILLKIARISISLIGCIKLTFIGNFFNMVVPGTVGGDVVKGYYLATMEKEKKGTGSGVVIVDRVVGLLALLFIGGMSALYLINMAGAKVHFYEYNIRAITAVVILILFVFFISLFFAKDQRVRKKVKDLAQRYLKEGFFYQMIEGFGALTKKKRYVLFALVLSLSAQILSLAGLLVFADIMRSDLDMVVSLMAVSSVILLIGIVPITPGNVGWIELLASLGWSSIGSDRGAEIFLYWRLVTICCSVPGGLIYLFYNKKRGQATF